MNGRKGATVDLRQNEAMIGGLVGALASGALAVIMWLTSFSWIGVAAMAALVIVGYILSGVLVGRSAGEFFRGFLVGANAAANAALGIVVYGALFGTTVGVVAGLLLGVVNLLAVLPPLSTGEAFQGLLGWINFLLPMSWLVTGLGFLFLLASAIGTLFAGRGAAAAGTPPFLKITRFVPDWKTGTFFVRGGFVANLNPLTGSAFNMGNFAFAKRDAPADMHLEHEAGHTLNLAAFGSLFHFVGAIDENVTGGGANAFAERLAESNNSAGSSVVKMWI
ncbi:MAG TPA: hypothetical protein VFL83_14120 [Anaeromyxobacter sp.]|nr:hypothetical protein [Anaeromyxobacter sp.]